MYKQKQKEEKTSATMMVLLIAGATAVILVFTITPWNYVPTQVTENASVLVVTEDDRCVMESKLGHTIVVPHCNAQAGDVISATFYVPSADLNGYYDGVKGKLETVEP